ncbi:MULTISPECIES: hypothetical protein [Burkholderiaceae]|uniref:Large polyvalent protein-associated domain-containing protein n=2 Tax=Burkholderiaceae TaxID=119060 RepID=A0A6J5JHL5_9BURK|nr:MULTISPECIES: hypothetical protein [Burkholderiaceae]ANJ73126.1 hypothetical protein A9Y76_11860 [Ralstonia insidiosa]KAB0601806.1 hypothetical protein F7R19_15005 [Cupriavidus pauculus]UAL00236.1 hypothetical protein K8O84_02345 [Cupriavidus pauculus]CAB3970807.1 hypothetical protein BLA3211_06129 [Burkholderia aenigmatica]
MFDMKDEHYQWHKSTIAQWDWTPETKINVQIEPIQEYSLDALNHELNDNMILDSDKPRDFFNFAIIKSVYDTDNGPDFAINDLTKLYGDYATNKDVEVKDILKQSHNHMINTHMEELLNTTPEAYPELKRKHDLEREVYEMNLAKTEEREPNLDKLQDSYFAYKTNFDFETHVNDTINQIAQGIQDKLDGLNHWIPSSGYEVPVIPDINVKSQVIEDPAQPNQDNQVKAEIPESKISAQMQAWLDRDGYSQGQKDIIARVDSQNQQDRVAAKEAREAEEQKQLLLEEYRQSKYPTVAEAKEQIHDNIDDAKGPRNFLDNTQGMFVNVAPESRYRDVETGEVHQLKTTGEIIERNQQYNEVYSNAKSTRAFQNKDLIAGQNIDAAVSIAAGELRLTQQKEISNFNGDFEALKTQEAKHKVEQTYFNVRHTELVDQKIPFKEEKQFQAAYTKYSQLENAEYISKIEKMYPEETKAISKQHEQSQTLEAVAHTVPLTMKPNREGYSSVEDVKSRLQAYEARRQEKLAAIDQAPAQESIQSILASQNAPQTAQTVQEVAQPIQAVEIAQNSPKTAEKVDPNHVRGVVVDYGSAPYLHDDKNNQSYYVTVLENGKERTKWGIDIGPALDRAEVQVGDFIDLQKTETVPAQATTKQGEKVSTHRNSWEATVEKPAQTNESEMFEYNGDTYRTNERENANQQAQTPVEQKPQQVQPQQESHPYDDMMKSIGQQQKQKQEQQAQKTESKPQETDEQRRARLLAEIEASKPISHYVDDFDKMMKQAAQKNQSQSQSKSKAISMF